MAANSTYRYLAEHYDRVFTFHIEWLEKARQTILGEILPSVKSACDLCCGTGTTALRLASGGVRMFGVDPSPYMCRIAREKARAAGLPLRVIRADMRRFRLPHPVDLITCEFDALNHVPRKTDLALVAQSAARALQPGGHFFFDVNNRTAFEKVWPGDWFFEKPGIVCVMRGSFDRQRDKGVTNVEWFIQEGKLWRRHTEHIEQVSWTEPEMRSTLRAAGFDRICAWDAMPFFTNQIRKVPGCRTFYLARKG